MKTRIIIYIASAIVAGLLVFFNPYTITKKSVLEKYEVDRFNDSTSIAKLSFENHFKDSLLFSIRQESDIKDVQLKEQQIILADLNKRLKQAKNDCTQANEAIAHYEENGLMRFFVFDGRGLFQKGCFKEVFEKPKNICE